MLATSPLDLDPAIIGARLSEARRARGLTQQEVAGELGVARTTITAIEKGTRKPRPSELAQLLLLYGRSVAEFARPTEIRESPGFLVQFREAKGSSPSTSDRNKAIQQFEQLCRWYRELEEAAGFEEISSLPPAYSLRSLNPAQAGEMLATAERNRLGIGDGPVADLWQILEIDVGIRIFSFPMRHTTIAGMFIYTDDLGACIALNANHPPERQQWSLAHEYAHLLTNRFRPEITILRTRHGNSQNERTADAFAMHFLLPASGLIRRFQIIQQETNGRITPAELIQLARLYGVSVEALTHRLEDLELLPADTWDRLRDVGFKPREAQRLLGISNEKTGKVRLPMRYEMLCVQAYRRGEFSEGQLSERLLRDRIDTRRIVDEISDAEALGDDGEIRQIPLDLGLDLMTQGR